MSRSRLLKKSIYVLSFIAVVMTAVLCFYPGQITYAATSGATAFDSTAVLDDLQGMTLNGKSFDVKDYPADPYGQIQLLIFVEYCYSQYENGMGYYGLYVYLWNPGFAKIDETHVLNSISMAVEFNSRDEASKYQKFSLAYCNKSDDGMFYKFKVIDTNNVILSVIEHYAKSHAGQRKYYVGEVEILTGGQTSAIAYKVGKQYVYEGFAEGYGDSNNFPLTMTSLGIDTIRTELGYAFYRPEGAVAKYSYTQNQLNSVYFSVPNWLIEKYGVLCAVHMQWYEYLTKEILVTSSSTVADQLKKYVGQKIAAFDSDVKYGYYVGYDDGGGDSYPSADKSYNNPCEDYVGTTEKMDTLFYVFDSTKLIDSTVTSVELLNYIQTYSGSGEKINGKYYKELFENYVEEGRTYGLNDFIVKPDDDINLLNYTFSSKWWQIGWGTHTDNSYKDIDAILEITADHFRGTQSGICKSLFIDESCYNDFKKAYDDAIGADEERTLFLIRFGVTNYTSQPAWVVEYRRGTFGSDRFSKVDTNAYCSQQTAFLDLDVIDVTFRDENEVETVIPVVSTPVDAIASVSKPIDYSGNKDYKKLIQLILIILILIIVCIICAPLLPYIVKAVLWVITLPFKIIGWIFKAIRRSSKRE